MWRIRQQDIEVVSDSDGYVSLSHVDVDLDDVAGWCRATLDGDSLGVPPANLGCEILPGWSDTWLLAPREELQVLRLHALEAAATRFLLSGGLGEACQAVSMAVRLDPLRESASRLLIEVYLREGNTVEAVRHYRRFASHMRDEVGAEPSPGTTALVAGHLLSDRPLPGRPSARRR
jgi:two-component SAPR family response regulator